MLRLICMFKFADAEAAVDAAPPKSLEPNSVCFHFGVMNNAPVSLLRKLLARGCTATGSLEDLQTPMHFCANYNETEEVIKFLIDNGGDANAKNKDGRTPKEIAELMSNSTFLKVVAEYKGTPVEAAAEKAADHVCSYCKKISDAQLSACSACRSAWYCSGDCQKAHWKEHKFVSVSCWRARGVWNMRLTRCACVCDANLKGRLQEGASGGGRCQGCGGRRKAVISLMFAFTVSRRGGVGGGEGEAPCIDRFAAVVDS